LAPTCPHCLAPKICSAEEEEKYQENQREIATDPQHVTARMINGHQAIPITNDMMRSYEHQRM